MRRATVELAMRRSRQTLFLLALGLLALLLLLMQPHPAPESLGGAENESRNPVPARQIPLEDASLAGRAAPPLPQTDPTPEGEQLRPAQPGELLVRVLDADGVLVPRVKALLETESEHDHTTWPRTEIVGGLHRYDRAWLDRFSKVSIRVGDPRTENGRPLNLQAKLVEAIDLDLGEITIRLEPGRRVTGRVVDARGTPVPDIQLEAGKRRAVSDAEGHFDLAGLPIRKLYLRVKRVDPWQAVSPILLPLDVTEVEVRLERGVVLRVLVLDPERRPVADVPVEMGDGRWRTQGRTDDAGTFLADGATAGSPVRIFVMTCYVDLPWPVAVVRDIDPAVGEITVQLEEAATVEGDLVFEDGTPVLDGSVIAVTLHNDRLGPGARWKGDGTTNHFVLPCLPSGPLILQAGRKGHSHASPEPVQVVAPAAEVRIVFAPSADFVGRILNEDRRDLGVMWTLGNMGYSANIRPDGAFLIKGVFDRPGYLYALQHETGKCYLREDVKPSDGPFEIRLVDGHRYEGRVEGYRKLGRYGPCIVCVRGDVLIVGHVADDGTFRVKGVPPGRWNVELWHEGKRRAGLENVEQDAQDLVIVMPDE